MPREFMEHPKGVFETPLGWMDWTLTSANNVYLSAGSTSHDQTPPLVIRNIDYRTSLHAEVDPDRPDVWVVFGNNVWMSRVGDFGQSGTPAAERRVRELVVPAWQAFILGKDRLRAEADLVALNNDIGRDEEELAKLYGKVREIEDRQAHRLSEEARIHAILPTLPQVRYRRKPKGEDLRQDWSPGESS